MSDHPHSECPRSFFVVKIDLCDRVAQMRKGGRKEEKKKGERGKREGERDGERE